MSTLGERLRKARENRGLKQVDVSQKTNINNRTLSRYEKDGSEPDSETLKILADLYEVSTDYLLGRTDKKENNDDQKYEEILNDPEFQHAMRSANGFTKENKSKVIEYIKMIEELERGRKPGDRQPRRR